MTRVLVAPTLYHHAPHIYTHTKDKKKTPYEHTPQLKPAIKTYSPDPLLYIHKYGVLSRMDF